MSLNVGELVALLTVDDSRFVKGVRNADSEMEKVQTTAKQTTKVVDKAFTEAGKGADTLGTKAKGATTDLSKVGNTANDIGKVDRKARQAASGVETIGTNARKSAQDMGKLGDAAGDAVKDIERTAGGASNSAGTNTASSFISGFADKLGDLSSKGGPVAGSILGVAVLGLAAGAALAKAIQDGMQSEMNRDMFQAQTGLSEAQARKFGLAAGESYADAFGESVNSNLGTAKAALENGLLDPASTQRDAEQMINSLSGVSTILGEDIPAVARAAGHAMKTGFADNATDAFDLIVKGSQMGLNVSEDWLDTINEYSVQFEKLGLTGAQSVGLMSQALKGGARDTDIAADALKEFSIRAVDGSKLSAEGFAAVGLNAEEMTAKIARGGPEASEGLAQVLDGLRGIQDPAARSAAAVALFGTQAEDLGDALFAMNLHTATTDMDGYQGAMQRAIDTMNGNAGTSVQGAMNSIQVAADGLKAALAQAFGPYIQQFADTVSNNRAGVIQFFIDIGNAAFEGGKSVLGFIEGGLRGMADFVRAGADMSAGFLRSLADMGQALDIAGNLIGMVFGRPIDTGGMSDDLSKMADQIEKVGHAAADGMEAGADGITNKLLPALEDAQGRFNEVAEGMKNSAAFNDASTKAGNAIAEIGVAADGSMIQLDNFTGAIDRNNAAQVAMDDKARQLAGAFQEQVRTGMEAGITVEALTAQYGQNREALIQQMIQTGMSRQAAEQYINTLGLTPEFVDTTIRQPGMPEAHYATDVLKGKVLGVPDSKTIHTSALTEESTEKLKALGLKVITLPDGTVKVIADTAEGERIMHEFLTRQRQLTVWVTTKRRKEENNIPLGAMGPFVGENGQAFADGGIAEKRPQIRKGQGRGITWAEDETDWEAYIPGATSKRGRATQILGETAKRFGLGLVKMADGGITGFDGEAAIAKAKSHNGEPYNYGALDCSGYLSAVLNAATGSNVRFTTDSNFASMGWEPGFDPDGFSIGTNNGVGMDGHMAGTLFGTNVESDGSNGIQYGGSADGARDFPEVWHWPGASGSQLVYGGTSYSEKPGAQLDLSKAIAEAEQARDGATTEADRAKAEARLAGLKAQQSGYSGITSGGAGLSTDGTSVFVTNWPASLETPKDKERQPILTAGMKVFKNGGVDNLPEQAGIYPDGANIVGFAEKGTGGEGYVPLHPSKRGRSVQITKDIANRFGYTLVPMADGGLTGFGGYQGGAGQPSLSLPFGDMTNSRRRSAMQRLTAVGVGGAFAVASGFDENGMFTGKFDTGANSHPGLERGFENLIPILEQIRDAAQKGETVDVRVDIDRGSRTANLAITKGGL